MPRYAPLPRIELDPRTEAELVKAAARRVYEASSSTLNDFSSGSPIMALLEGQSFAQGEFLQFANQFPESVLVEWIGPFLGAQRRTGAGALVDITFTIDPSDSSFTIFEGYQISTDANLTGGDAVKFVTLERLIIPPGQIEGSVRAIAVETGTKGIVPPNTITKNLTSLSGIRSVNNVNASFGAQDAELLSEVKERFFSLIRRRNPVSAEDWTDWFSDALGAGTTVSVLPRHSERGAYEYQKDYIRSNPGVTFYVLNPDGTPISTPQRDALETLAKWSLPIEFMGYIYPMEVNDVDVNISMEYDAAKPYSQNLHDLSARIRGALFSLMTPNAVFPIDYDPSVLDVQNALTATFPITLGVGNRFTDPNIKDIQVYSPPTGIGISAFQGVVPTAFQTGGRFGEGDLVIESLGSETLYYPVTSSFDPNNNDKSQYTNRGMLQMERIQPLISGQYSVGDVVSFPGTGGLHVCLTEFFYEDGGNPLSLIVNKFISEDKKFTAFTGEIKAIGSSGTYDPDIISYDQADATYVQYIYPEPSFVDENKRIGNPVFVATQDFVVDPPTNTLGQAQIQGLVLRTPISMNLLVDGESYTAGTYVKTPNENELRFGVANTSVCYMTSTEGLKEEYFLVQKDFTFVLDQAGYSELVEELLLDEILTTVKAISFSECGRSKFKNKPFRYSTRFKLGEYLRYREEGGFSSAELEDCLEESQSTEGCNLLLSSQLPVPRYFQALSDFTPYTTDLNQMIEDGVIVEVEKYVFNTTYEATLTMYVQAYSYNIVRAMVEANIIQSESDLVEGDTLQLMSTEGFDRGVWRWVSGSWLQIMPSQAKHRDIFRLAPGDVVSFRQESTIKSYRATEHFTPVLSPTVYIKSGALIDDGLATANKMWIDPEYNLEDFVYEVINGAFSFYRIISPVTPSPEEVVWNDQLEQNTARILELKRKTLKMVVSAKCGDEIFSRLRDNASSIKLGVANMTFKSKESLGEKDRYVWEATQYASETPSISFSPTLSNWDYKPVEYNDGTLTL